MLWCAVLVDVHVNVHAGAVHVGACGCMPADKARRGVQVTVSRRGLRNQLKTFLFRSKSNASSETPRAGPAASGGPAQYGAATTEGQMRQLADLAFVMQDYETAQSTLKLLASDYKTDKAWKHLAGVQVRLLASTGQHQKVAWS